ncbi:MAG TPA: cob(I)yrinic acid a,c-diamide adenosyltransferase [Anaeromyxobacteraceae bacterium]|nr:cob(I)yrinic acid a,c-diamide adenosyltransferase [Anaeromyxobacteraceae bacterium]
MKIYTKTGDAGTTGLFGGPRVPKDHRRVEAYGAVDELNAALGVVRARGAPPELEPLLALVQEHLFTLGALLATPPGVKAREAVPALAPSSTEDLEAAIDRFETELTPLRHFVLPGGVPLAADLHFARAVCRRAERRVVALNHESPLEPEALVFLNRLSDFLFVAARLANQRAGAKETPWVPRKHG